MADLTADQGKDMRFILSFVRWLDNRDTPAAIVTEIENTQSETKFLLGVALEQDKENFRQEKSTMHITFTAINKPLMKEPNIDYSTVYVNFKGNSFLIEDVSLRSYAEFLDNLNYIYEEANVF